MSPDEGVEGDVEALPARLGRFEVLGRLGEGGMGHVLRARDPQLDREVAIKVLRSELDDTVAPLHAEVARKRLLREAQAMARLDHPNVIGVHEVGEDGGRIFLVMERVAGTTLDGWLRAASRGWRGVLALFAQVGAGLAAAHAAGLVHRDIKPGNVLVGDDGRARITDFGLVGVEAGRDVRALDSAAEPPALTHDGAMVGTPGYMAPEQLRGQVADPRSDQFGLCVTLYEALYGESPFAGAGFREMAVAVLEGSVRPAPAGSDVPAAVRAAVLRGLAVDPAARWPDVAALMAALAAPSARPARRRSWLVVPLAAVVAAGTFLWTRPRTQPAPVPTLPVPPTAVLTEVASGACDNQPVFVDDDTLVYRHAERTVGFDLRVRSLAGRTDRALTSTPTIDEMFPQPAIGERAIVAIPKERTDSGAGPARIDLDTGTVTPLPGGSGIFFNPGAVLAGGALYYVLGNGAQFMELRDGVVTERASFPGAFVFSVTVDRAARFAALQVSGAGICLVDLRATAPPRCLELAETSYGRPAFDAAGRVYYGGISGIRRHDPATGEDVLVIRDRGINGGMAVSPSGRTLVWSECQPQIEITRPSDGAVQHAESLTGASVNRAGGWAFVRETPSASLIAYRDPQGLVHVLTRGDQGIPGAPALDPDSDAIVFSMSEPSPGFYLAHGQSHKPIRKISGDTGLQGPVWIDATHVAVTKLDADGLPFVHVFDLDTATDRRAIDRPRMALDRQPDGDVLLLASDDRKRLFLWNPATGEEREIVLPPEVAGRGNVGAALSPGARAVDLVIGPTVWRVTVDGSEAPRQVFAPPEGKGFWGIEIGHDGAFYAMVSEDRGDLFRITLPP
jgi:tRNA A-37 threonylcarbamoyl transferase component Bud32